MGTPPTPPNPPTLTLTALQANVTALMRGEAATLFFLHDCSYFSSEGDKTAAGPESISLSQQQQEQQQLLFIGAGAWKRWLVGRRLSRKPLRLPTHIVSMMANLFRWSGTTSVRYGTRAGGYEQQDRYFSIVGAAERRRRIPIILGGCRARRALPASSLLSPHLPSVVFTPPVLQGLALV